MKASWAQDAVILAALGRSDEAHAAMRQAIAQGDFRAQMVLLETSWDSQRADPRFPELVRLAKLPQQALDALEVARASRSSTASGVASAP